MYKESDLYKELYAKAVSEHVYVDFTPVSSEPGHCVVLCTVSNKDGLHIVKGGETKTDDQPFLAAMEQAGLAALGIYYNTEVPVSVGDTSTKNDTPDSQSIGQQGISNQTKGSAEPASSSAGRQPSGSRSRQDSSTPPSTVGRTSSNQAPGRQSGGPSSPPAGRTTGRPGENMAQAGRPASGAGGSQAVNYTATSSGRPSSGNARQNTAGNTAAGSRPAAANRAANTAAPRTTTTEGQKESNAPYTNTGNPNSGGVKEEGPGNTTNTTDGTNQMNPIDSSAPETQAPNPNMPKDFRVKIGAYAREENNYISYLIKHDPEFVRTVCRLENSLPAFKEVIENVQEYVKAAGIDLG